MTSTRDCLRAAALVAAFGVFVLYPDASRSGDEVDYSAPYLVVENGELVTRYPAKSHEPDLDKPVEGTPAEATHAGTRSWIIPAVLIAAIAGAGGLVFARIRR